MQVRLSELAQLQPENTPNQLTLWNMDDIPAIRPNYVPGNTLPETGMLYFFHIDFNIVTDEFDVWASVFDDPERSLVFYADSENHGLVRQPYPVHDHVPLLNALPAHRMKLHRRMSLPWFHDLSDFQSSQFSEQQADAYYDMVEAHIPQPCHFFFGYPLEVQGDIEWACVVDTQ